MEIFNLKVTYSSVSFKKEIFKKKWKSKISAFSINNTICAQATKSPWYLKFEIVKA
jgi:hypothetical protein